MESPRKRLAATRCNDPYRLLRLSRRTKIGHCRIFEGIGQLQPVLMGRSRHGGLEFRIETTAEHRGKTQPCWMVIQLPEGKRLAKQLLASLEAANAAGKPSAAALAWAARQKEGQARNIA